MKGEPRPKRQHLCKWPGRPPKQVHAPCCKALNHFIQKRKQKLVYFSDQKGCLNLNDRTTEIRGCSFQRARRTAIPVPQAGGECPRPACAPVPDRQPRGAGCWARWTGEWPGHTFSGAVPLIQLLKIVQQRRSLSPVFSELEECLNCATARHCEPRTAVRAGCTDPRSRCQSDALRHFCAAP